MYFAIGLSTIQPSKSNETGYEDKQWEPEVLLSHVHILERVTATIKVALYLLAVTAAARGFNDKLIARVHFGGSDMAQQFHRPVGAYHPVDAR